MPPLLISKKRRFTTKHNTTTTTTKDPNYYQISSTLRSCQGKEKTQEERERERDQETNQTHHPKTKPKSSSGTNFPSTLHHEQLSKLNPAWVVEKMGPPSVESFTWEGGGSTF